MEEMMKVICYIVWFSIINLAISLVLLFQLLEARTDIKNLKEQLKRGFDMTYKGNEIIRNRIDKYIFDIFTTKLNL